MPRERSNLSSETPRLGPWAVLGAWLRIWTPPKGARVPPVPKARLALAALLALALAGGLAAVVVPRVESLKRAADLEERRHADSRAAARSRRLRAEQRPLRGRVAPPPAGARSDPDVERRARAALLARVESSITADARRRVAAGRLDHAVQGTNCRPYPPTAERARAERDLTRNRAVYECVAVTTRIPPSAGNAAGVLGYPFRVVVDFGDFTYVWCKIDPVPGERVGPHPRTAVPVPRACAG